MSTDAEKLKQKQKIRKYLVFTGMFLLFLGCMWLIFAPSEKDRQEAERKTGFNAELPDPKGTGIEADKMAAYEQADMIRRQEEKKRTLADFSALTDGHRQDNVPETEPAQDIASENESRAYNSGGNGRTGAFASSASAYNDINATLGSFYESPEEDPEKEALKAEVEQLRQAAAAQTAGPSYEEQVALLEKSYELAARYMPSGGSTGTADSQETESPSRERKAKAVPVGRVVPSSASYRFGTVREAAFRCGCRLPYGCGQCRDTDGEEYHTGLRAWRPDHYQRTKRASQAAGGHACGKIRASPQYPADR